MYACMHASSYNNKIIITEFLSGVSKTWINYIKNNNLKTCTVMGGNNVVGGIKGEEDYP